MPQLIGALLAIAAAILVIYIVVHVVFYALVALTAIGTIFGAGTALRNYVLAFSRNVRFERPSP